MEGWEGEGGGGVRGQVIESGARIGTNGGVRYCRW